MRFTSFLLAALCAVAVQAKVYIVTMKETASEAEQNELEQKLTSLGK